MKKRAFPSPQSGKRGKDLFYIIWIGQDFSWDRQLISAEVESRPALDRSLFNDFENPSVIHPNPLC
jgi:hypothetical protein